MAASNPWRIVGMTELRSGPPFAWIFPALRSVHQHYPGSDASSPDLHGSAL